MPKTQSSPPNPVPSEGAAAWVYRANATPDAHTLGGLGNFHQTECLPGALPRDQNAPRRPPYGLCSEQINGTGFTVERKHNTRSWLYRVRPSAQQGAFAPLPHPTFTGSFAAARADPNLTAFRPLPLPQGQTDFVDGLFTLGGAGCPRLRRGFALHVYAANQSMQDRCFCSADGDLLLLPERGVLDLTTELGRLRVAPGHLALLPRGLRFSVALEGPDARGYLAETYGRPFELPERGPVGANGLADPRHFQAPCAWYEDRGAPGYRVTHKYGGHLYEARQDHSPYDVVAWQGNFAPYTYDFMHFSPVGNTRFDHGDPSVYTVLSSGMDEPGVNSLDLVVFVPRWDPTEHTFRPPFFHRNATHEINGIIKSPARGDSPFQAGCVFTTPAMTPHGVTASSVQRAHDTTADEPPQRLSDDALWFQFESALPLCLTSWAEDAPHRILDWRAAWGEYRSHFDPQQPSHDAAP